MLSAWFGAFFLAWLETFIQKNQKKKKKKNVDFFSFFATKVI